MKDALDHLNNARDRNMRDGRCSIGTQPTGFEQKVSVVQDVEIELPVRLNGREISVTVQLLVRQFCFQRHLTRCSQRYSRWRAAHTSEEYKVPDDAN